MTVTKIVAQQHVKIVRYPQRFHGRGTAPGKSASTSAKKKYQAYLEQQSDQALDAIRDMPGDRRVAILTHRPLVQVLNQRRGDRLDDWQVERGHWGAHEKGHNHWSKRNLVIFGGPYLSTADQAKRYSAARVFALVAGASPDDWPAWDDETETKQWILEGAQEVQAIAPLPADPRVREWVLRDYVAKVVQAIGRVRGVWGSADDPFEVHIYGGLPLFGIWEHGLHVHEYREDPAGWKTLDGHNRAQAADAEARFQMAVEAIESVGGKVTYRSVVGYLHTHGLPAPAPETFRKLQAGAGRTAGD